MHDPTLDDEIDLTLVVAAIVQQCGGHFLLSKQSLESVNEGHLIFEGDPETNAIRIILSEEVLDVE